MQIRNVFSLMLYVAVFSVCTYYNFLEKTETTMHYLLSALMLLFFLSCIAVLGVMINQRSIQGARTYPTGRLFRELRIDDKMQQDHFSNFIRHTLNIEGVRLNKGQTMYSYLTTKYYSPEDVRTLRALLKTDCDTSIRERMANSLNVNLDDVPVGVKPQIRLGSDSDSEESLEPSYFNS